jgi:predicted ATP-binding protein involved in virulence
MRLVSANVGPIKSIEKPVNVKIEERVTVLVGMNESGKTVFLQALQKSDDVFGTAKFDPVDDYPRKNLNTYERRHADNPDTATELTFALSKEEIANANEQFHLQLLEQFNFKVTHRYDNLRLISCNVDEKPVLLELAKQVDLSAEYRAALQ